MAIVGHYRSTDCYFMCNCKKHTADKIIGVTKVKQVEEAVNAAKIILTSQEIKEIETLAAKTGVDTRGWWGKR